MIRGRALRAATLFISILWSFNTDAEKLDASDVYRRCYVRMVRAVPNEKDPLLLAVIAGTKTGPQACIELFDRARFTSSGILTNRTSEDAKQIVRTFHDLHQSWFQSKFYGFTSVVDILRDIEEPALYFTRAAFQPSVKFNSIVTHNQGLQGVRDQMGYPNELNAFHAQTLFRYPLPRDRSQSFSFANFDFLRIVYRETPINPAGRFATARNVGIDIPNANIVEVGHLVGIKPANRLPLPNFRYVTPPTTDATLALEVNAAVQASMSTFDANQHMGGGILGSQTFLMNNMNLAINQIPHEYDRINRRLTSRVFEDLMCHTLPTLQPNDVASEVVPTSPHTFQRDQSCMRCHSSIDGLGYGYRNLVVFRSAGEPVLPSQDVGVPVSGVSRLPASAGATTFALKAPSGRLHFRELITGKRHSVAFNTLSQLGASIALRPDIYTCAAMRYYRFFTGVDVNLVSAATEPLDKLHQDKVRELAATLNSGQSVRTILLGIFNSDAFQTANYLTEK